MIDIKLLRFNFNLVKEKILKKDPSFPIQELFEKDKSLNDLKKDLDEKLFENNKIAKLFIKSDNSEDLRKQSIELQKEISSLKNKIEELEKDFMDMYLSCPNLPDDSLPCGDKSCNKVIKIFGNKKKIDFEPKNHVQLFEINNILDLAKGSSVSKSGFLFYSNDLTFLIQRLCMIFIKHNESYGFKSILPPYLISQETLKNAGNYPRFKDEVFYCEKDKLYLLPTSEVAIASLHTNETFEKEELPKRYTSWSSCFRREVGGYGSHERGLIRIHQFEKVEIFSFTTKEKAEEEHLMMLNCIESLVQRFGLHYQVSLLATQDCSFSSAKTYDLELWLPGQKEYREISSISNCTDFQSRRSKTKYKIDSKNKDYVNTLNGSSLAIPRLIVGLIETYQEKNGDINFSEIFKLISSIEKSFL